MSRLLALCAVAFVAIAADARAQALVDEPPETPPVVCRGDAFVNLVGTSGGDALTAPNRAARVYGLDGGDRLTGSSNRASCLFGGLADDVLALNAGGGAAYGGKGADLLFGSDLGDVVDGGTGSDGFFTTAGDDKVFARDGRPELVDCGAGADQAKVDRSDLLVGCESINPAGDQLPRIGTRPASTHVAGRIRFRLPSRRTSAAGYRVVYVNACRNGGLLELERLGRVRAGREVPVRLDRPEGGWCRDSTVRLAVLRDPGQSLPLVPVARLSFTVR